jgi:hypothetical protein
MWSLAQAAVLLLRVVANFIVAQVCMRAWLAVQRPFEIIAGEFVGAERASAASVQITLLILRLVPPLFWTAMKLPQPPRE